MAEVLKQKLNKLPVTPGVYFHKNASGEIIYVGKAAVLKNRVRQYFQKSKKDTKTEALVAEISDVDWIQVDTEGSQLASGRTQPKVRKVRGRLFQMTFIFTLKIFSRYNTSSP